jgi:hypothetical protein
MSTRSTMQPPQQGQAQVRTIRAEFFRFINNLPSFRFFLLAFIAGYVSQYAMERWFRSPAASQLSGRFPVPKPLTASVPVVDIAQMLRYRSSLNHFSDDDNYSDRYYGLLKDISLGSNNDDTYFTAKLNISETKELLNDDEYLYSCAEKDAKELNRSVDDYLKEIVDFSWKSIHSVELYGREVIMALLREYVSKPGTAMCVLGDKDSGKSFALHSLQSEFPSSVLLVDGRVTGTDILGGITMGLEKIVQRKGNSLFNIVRNILKIRDNSFVDSRQALREVVKSLRSYGINTLIVDEAQLVFTTHEPMDMDLQQLMIALTKREVETISSELHSVWFTSHLFSSFSSSSR